MASNLKTDNRGNGQDDGTVKTQGQAPEVRSNEPTDHNTNNNNKNNARNKPSHPPNTENESPFVKLVRDIKIEDLEKEIKEEDGWTTSILSRFKDYQQDLINMAKDATITSAKIISFVMNPKRVGLTDEDDATLFVARLREANPIQSQSNGM